MPSYHSFVKGVVDSDGLPPYISRFKRNQLETTNTAYLSTAMGETTHRSTDCLIQKAMEEHSLVEDNIGDKEWEMQPTYNIESELFDKAYKENVANKRVTDTLRFGSSQTDSDADEMADEGEEPPGDHDDQDQAKLFKDMTKTSLRTTTNQAPARRKPTTPPTTRREQPREPLPSCQRIDVEKVAKVPAEVREEVSDEEVHGTEDAHHKVDIRQDDAATITQDDVQAERLFEDAPAVKEPNEGLTRPRRVPKPNSRYSPEDYDLNYVKAHRGTRAGLRHDAQPCPGGDGGGHNYMYAAPGNFANNSRATAPSSHAEAKLFI
jgi:hypothetical protein